MEASSVDFGGGYSSSFRLMRVDPSTWADADEIGGLVSASVERDRSNDLMESGSVTLLATEPPSGEVWARIEMLADSGTAVERHAIATLLLFPGQCKATMGGIEVEMAGRSVLAPADDVVLLAGTYAPLGADGAEYAASLLRECIPAPVHVHGGFKLSDHVVFARGTTYLEAAWMLLDTAGWCMQVDGRGEVTIMPMPDEPSLLLDKAGARMLGTEVQVDDGLSEVPNRVIAVQDELVAMAVDETDSPTSYPTRGRYVDLYEESPTLVDGETLQAYANRRLLEETNLRGKRSYTREFWPGVYPFSLVKGSLPEVGLDEYMRVLSQSLEIGAGTMVSEVSEVLK